MDHPKSNSLFGPGLPGDVHHLVGGFNQPIWKKSYVRQIFFYLPGENRVKIPQK